MTREQEAMLVQQVVALLRRDGCHARAEALKVAFQEPARQHYNLDIEGLWARAQVSVVAPGAPDFTGWRVSEVVRFLLGGPSGAAASRPPAVTLGEYAVPARAAYHFGVTETRPAFAAHWHRHLTREELSFLDENRSTLRAANLVNHPTLSVGLTIPGYFLYAERQAPFATQPWGLSQIRDTPDAPAGETCECGCGIPGPTAFTAPDLSRYLSPTIRLNQVSAEGVVGHAVEFPRELEYVARRVLERDGWEALEAWAQALAPPQGRIPPEVQVVSADCAPYAVAAGNYESGAWDFSASVAACGLTPDTFDSRFSAEVEAGTRKERPPARELCRAAKQLGPGPVEVALPGLLAGETQEQIRARVYAAFPGWGQEADPCEEPAAPIEIDFAVPEGGGPPMPCAVEAPSAPLVTGACACCRRLPADFPEGSAWGNDDQDRALCPLCLGVAEQERAARRKMAEVVLEGES